MPTPSELRKQLEARIAAENRDDDVKAKEFMSTAPAGSLSQERAARSVRGGFGKAPSSVKAGWEARLRDEERADDVKAREFGAEYGWSERRAQVTTFGARPSDVKRGVEVRVKEEGRSDDDKARRYVEENREEGKHDAPRILAGPDAVKAAREADARRQALPGDERARLFLEETTYKGVARREFKKTLIPLSVLFSKPHKDYVRLSPKGTYLAWRTRGRSMGDPHERDNGVMNVFAKSLETGKIRQITFSSELDACICFKFTPDDRSIVLVREARRGSESYHLDAVEVGPFFEQDDAQADDPRTPPPATPRGLICDPEMTCCVGFMGAVQLWTSGSSPREVFCATSKVGPKAMFWDVSRVDIDTGEVTPVERNVMSTGWGAFRVMIATIFARALNFLFGCCCPFLVPKPPRVPIQWFPDEELDFRGRLEVDLVSLGSFFCARPKGDKNWQTLHHCTFEEANLQLIGSVGGTGTLRMEFRGPLVDVHLCAVKGVGGKMSDTTTYDRFDVRRGSPPQYVKRIAGGNSRSDIVGFVCHPLTGRAQMAYYEYEKTELELFSEDELEGEDRWRLEDDLDYIRSFFPSSVSWKIVSRSNSDEQWVLLAESDVGRDLFKGSPSAYFLFTRRAEVEMSEHGRSASLRHNMELIFPSRPEMKKYKLARMDPVHVPARDGEDILCYLSRTQPKPSIRGRAEEPPGPPPPLVVYVHGGPQARDSWGYNPVCQMLCSRGFRVLQVNYRGSTGFGARFLRLGMDGQFNKSLQEDIVDAVQYATSKERPMTESTYTDEDMPPLPWGDANKLAIMGGSFGGYSALWGVTAFPNMYKAAVAICPISSVGAADNESRKAFWGSPLIARYWQHVFGEDVAKKRNAARKASPMYNIGKICGWPKVGLYHGEGDPRAPVGHSFHVMKELKKCGIAGELVTFSGEGHGISKDANKLYMYYRIEEFLCREFGMEVFDAGDAVKMKGNTGSVRWSAEYKKRGTEDVP